MTQLHNPYIAGKALGQEQGFFGRQDVLDLVAAEMAVADHNAVVLFGQRRIGKTSILLQLRRRLQRPLVPVYFDLMDRAHKPLGQVLYEWAATIAREVRRAVPARDAFDDEGACFRHEFLPSLYRTLPDGERPVLLLDEFDVLDVSAESELSPRVAARSFFPFLRQLMEGEPRLGFVFVVGRKAEDLSIDVKATFKAARYKRVSVLDEGSADTLVRSAEKQGTLAFAPGAAERILALTSGHPYLTQLTCQLLWDGAHEAVTVPSPVVDVTAVDAVVPRVLEAGENVFEWIWDGLPPAERVIFASIAAATSERGLVYEQELLDLLQRHGIRILTHELELAPKKLVEWEMLREAQGSYGFFVELLRRWIADRKPMAKVKDELDRTVPRADRLYRVAEDYYHDGDLENAKDQLQKALRTNPNHLKARLRLGQVLQDEGKLEEAVAELEQAYKYDDAAARHPLIRALLLRADAMEREGRETTEVLAVYARVLALSPQENIAQERTIAIWTQIGDRAVEAGDLDAALKAYREVGDEDKVREIQARRERQALEFLFQNATEHERREEWEQAMAAYQRLAATDTSEAARWEEALKRCQIELLLSKLYTEGIGAYKQKNWAQAIDAWAKAVHIRPEYKDVSDLLADAVRSKSGRTDLGSRQLIITGLGTALGVVAGFLLAQVIPVFERIEGPAKPDLAALLDMRRPPDLRTPPDMRTLPDLRTPPDLRPPLAPCLSQLSDACPTPAGCYDLARKYYDGTGVRQNFEVAACLFEKACIGGGAKGCYYLGFMYDNAQGMAKDLARAGALYRKACDWGEAAACTNLGFMYAQGNGVAKDVASAAKLYRKACDSGEGHGCSNLGFMYENGMGIIKDTAEAIKLFKKACDGCASREGPPTRNELGSSVDYAAC